MPSSSRHTWHEIIGLVLMGGGVLLLLALLSYEPRDLPSWIFYTKYSSMSPVPLNFVGRFGAVMAGLCFFLFGGASFFAAAALLGLGFSRFVGEESPLGIRLGWSLIFVLSWAYFLDFLDHFRFFSTSWKQTLALPGAGGWFGHALGIAVGKNTMGVIGTIFLFFITALTSLILATGFHPITTSKRACVRLGKLCIQLYLFLKNQCFQTPSLSSFSNRGEKSQSFTPSLTPKKASVRRSKKGVEESQEDQQEESVGNENALLLPSPKIIDASIPIKKPTLAEVMKPKHSSRAGGEAALLSHVALEHYTLPPLSLLETHENKDCQPADPAVLQGVQRVLIETLAEFGIAAAPGDITKGPTITRYELYPASGVRVDRIANLERDLARATSAERINILAPIPGKDTVGIEIANSNKVTVAIRELFESDLWQSSKAKLPLALGKDVYGNAIIADLAQMPHLLVAGATGSGKSVCINSIITSLICKHTPETLRFIMIDPKVVEMQIYNKLPHLVTPVVTDPKKVLLALRWVIDEMELRYKIFAKTGMRNITGFNGRPQLDKEKNQDIHIPEEGLVQTVSEDAELSELDDEIPRAQAVPHQAREEEELIIPDHLPFIVVIVDELADLMQTAPADVESAIARITQMARAAGIHMIVATQTPRADVVTGIIKANIPTRIAFQVASKLDSRVILDQNGADRLLGQGDMLYLPPGSAKVIRAQGVLVTDEEIGRMVDFLGEQSKPIFEPSIVAKLSNTTMPEEDITEGEEELVTKCLEIIRQEKKASTSMLQRRLRLGYTRAARVVDILEQRGILGPKDGARDREILIDLG